MGSRPHYPEKISPVVEENIHMIQKIVGTGIDTVVREFVLGNGQRAAIFYFDGLIDKNLLGEDVFGPLKKYQGEPLTAEATVQQILRIGGCQVTSDFAQVFEMALQGLTILFLEGETAAVSIEIVSWSQRAINEPATDVVIRGPREGFIETLRVNVSLLRRKIHHPDFRTETVRLGRYSQTDVCLVYVESIVNRGVLEQVRARLNKIDVDAILDSGQVEQLIQGRTKSVFPTVNIAEKPDIAAARILEGRVAILVDGSPLALTVPMLFAEGLNSPGDYYIKFQYATWIRVIRYLAFLVALYLPGFYLALTGYHQHVLPFRLLSSLVDAEAETPFSSGVSVLLIWLSYEILREAGIRLPKPAGQAISIVGAIIMGDAAVNAGLISAPVLIVLAATVVASFVSSAYIDGTALLRLAFLLLGWIWGFLGLLLGTVVLVTWLCSLESFGIPYFAPFAPVEPNGLRDSAVRAPISKLKFRPSVLSRNHRRMGGV